MTFVYRNIFLPHQPQLGISDSEITVMDFELHNVVLLREEFGGNVILSVRKPQNFQKKKKKTHFSSAGVGAPVGGGGGSPT